MPSPVEMLPLFVPDGRPRHSVWPYLHQIKFGQSLTHRIEGEKRFRVAVPRGIEIERTRNVESLTIDLAAELVPIFGNAKKSLDFDWSNSSRLSADNCKALDE